MSDLVPHDNGGGLQPTGQQPPPFAPASPVTRPQVEDTIDLRELIDVLRRNKRLILAITLVFTLFAFVIVSDSCRGTARRESSASRTSGRR